METRQVAVATNPRRYVLNAPGGPSYAGRNEYRPSVCSSRIRDARFPRPPPRPERAVDVSEMGGRGGHASDTAPRQVEAGQMPNQRWHPSHALSRPARALAADEAEGRARAETGGVPSPAAATGGPSGTITFLFTDIEDSSRRWETQAEGMMAALARHDAIVRAAIEGQGGYVFKTVGDAFHAAFATAGAALAAAVAAQRA